MDTTLKATSSKSGFAPVNGLNLYYEIHGEGFPLVYIHPAWGSGNLMFNWENARDVFPYFTKRHQVIAIDLQGHGKTPDIDRPLSFEQFANDIAVLIDFLELKQPDIFGESFGGIVAMLLAVNYPNRIRRVVTYSSGFGKLDDVNQRNYDQVQRAENTEFKKQAAISADSDIFKNQRENYLKTSTNPQRWPDLFKKVLGIQWNGLYNDALKSVVVPVLIVVGDHDFVPIEYSLNVAKTIPHAQLAVIPDAGHFVLGDAPSRLLTVISDFLDAEIPGKPYATPWTGYQPGSNR